MGRVGGRTLSILVVEDDPAVAELLRTLLNRVSGWGATVVHDASAARAVFTHARVEALVLDVNLPGISGIELLRLLESDPQWHHPPVVLTSAGVDPAVVQRAAGDRANMRFVPKPFDVDEIVDVLAEMVEGQATASETAPSVAGAPAVAGATDESLCAAPFDAPPRIVLPGESPSPAVQRAA